MSMSDFADGWMTEPSSNCSDYCTRDLTVDLSSEDVYDGVLSSRLWTSHNPKVSLLCSNKAHGCRNQTFEAFLGDGLLSLKQGQPLYPKDLRMMWDALNRDNSPSAASTRRKQRKLLQADNALLRPAYQSDWQSSQTDSALRTSGSQQLGTSTCQSQ